MSADLKESLKRALLKIKGEARSMRKGNLEARLNPKPKEVPAEEVAVAEEAPLELAAEPDAKAARAKEIASIKKLLARS